MALISRPRDPFCCKQPAIKVQREIFSFPPLPRLIRYETETVDFVLVYYSKFQNKYRLASAALISSNSKECVRGIEFLLVLGTVEICPTHDLLRDNVFVFGGNIVQFNQFFIKPVSWKRQLWLDAVGSFLFLWYNSTHFVCNTYSTVGIRTYLGYFTARFRVHWPTVISVRGTSFIARFSVYPWKRFLFFVFLAATVCHRHVVNKTDVASFTYLSLVFWQRPTADQRLGDRTNPWWQYPFKSSLDHVQRFEGVFLFGAARSANPNTSIVQ